MRLRLSDWQYLKTYQSSESSSSPAVFFLRRDMMPIFARIEESSSSAACYWLYPSRLYRASSYFCFIF